MQKKIISVDSFSKKETILSLHWVRLLSFLNLLFLTATIFDQDKTSNNAQVTGEVPKNTVLFQLLFGIVLFQSGIYCKECWKQLRASPDKNTTIKKNNLDDNLNNYYKNHPKLQKGIILFALGSNFFSIPSVIYAMTQKSIKSNPTDPINSDKLIMINNILVQITVWSWNAVNITELAIMNQLMKKRENNTKDRVKYLQTFSYAVSNLLRTAVTLGAGHESFILHVLTYGISLPYQMIGRLKPSSCSKKNTLNQIAIES